MSFGDAEEEEENELSSSIHKKLHSKGTIGQKKTIKKKKMNVPSEEKIEDNVKPKSKKGAEDFQKAMLDKAKQMQEKFEEPSKSEESKDESSSNISKKKSNSKREAILLLEQERMKYKKKQSSKTERQKKVMSSLAAFNSTLRGQLQKEPEKKVEEESKKELMYDKDYDKESDVVGAEWMATRLKFTTPIKVRRIENYFI